MKVRIKNNRLALEGQIDSLTTAPEHKLNELAAKYQIGTNRLVSKEVPYISRGRAISKVEESYEKKTRKQIEDEIRKVLTISYFIPRSMFTPEQEETFTTSDLFGEKDIAREEQIKLNAGIKVVLPPFEKGDSIKEASLMREVTEMQWDHLKETFNYSYKRVKDDDGRTIDKKRGYVHRLSVVEMIPENDEDAKRLKDEKKPEEKKKADKK